MMRLMMMLELPNPKHWIWLTFASRSLRPSTRSQVKLQRTAEGEIAGEVLRKSTASCGHPIRVQLHRCLFGKPGLLWAACINLD